MLWTLERLLDVQTQIKEEPTGIAVAREVGDVRICKLLHGWVNEHHLGFYTPLAFRNLMLDGLPAVQTVRCWSSS